MARKPEEIVAKLRQVEVLPARGKPVGDGGDGGNYYHWRSEDGGLKLDQMKRLKLLE
jgi:putative transposase